MIKNASDGDSSDGPGEITEEMQFNADTSVLMQNYEGKPTKVSPH